MVLTQAAPAGGAGGPAPPAATERLQVDALCFSHPGGPPLLDGVSFSLAAGQVLCLLGPNGSGKTSLLRCVLGLETLAGGQVRLDGVDLSALKPVQRARRMAYVPQSSATAFPFSVFDVVLMGRSAHLRFMADPDADDHAAARAALERLQVGHLEHRRFQELSGGERQLVLVARALAQQAPLLVLDEPCAGLDIGHQVQLLQALRSLARAGYAILLSTHSPDHAFFLRARVGLLAAGRWQGPAAAEQLLDAATLQRVYGAAVQVLTLDQGAAAGQRIVVPVLETRHEPPADAPPAVAGAGRSDSGAGPGR